MGDLAGVRLRPSGPPPPSRRRRRSRALGVVVVLAVLLALTAGAVVGGRQLLGALRGGAAADYAGNGTGEVLVQVDEGDSASDIAATLEDEDVVKSAAAFRRAAADDERSRSVQPGTYELRKQMSARAALARLLDPAARARTRVTLPEGLTAGEALVRIADSTDIPLADLRSAVANPSSLGLPPYARGRIEGLLFPATYELAPGSSAVEALRLMVDRFEQIADDLDLARRARDVRRTPYELLISASLVEEETAAPGDRPKVARVIYNRLQAGMRLQFDSTVNYVRKERKLRLSEADLQVESAYNTYRNAGLPPTPISSPGRKSLEAALSPAAGDYLYFVVVDREGRSLFTKSYDEFLAAKAKAKREGVY